MDITNQNTLKRDTLPLRLWHHQRRRRGGKVSRFSVCRFAVLMMMMVPEARRKGVTLLAFSGSGTIVIIMNITNQNTLWNHQRACSCLLDPGYVQLPRSKRAQRARILGRAAQLLHQGQRGLGPAGWRTQRPEPKLHRMDLALTTMVLIHRRSR